MKSIGEEELAARIDEVLGMVKQGETVEVVRDGKVVARVMPPEENRQRDQKEIETFIAAMDQIEKEVSKHITGPVDAVEIVREGRRGY